MKLAIYGSTHIFNWLAACLLILGASDGLRADEGWVPTRSWLEAFSVQNGKLLQLAQKSINAIIVSDLYPDDPDSVTVFHTMQKRVILADGKFENGATYFLFNEPFVSGNRWIVYSAWIYPRHALFEVGKLGAKPLLLSCSLADSSDMREMSKVEVKTDPRSHFAQVTDSDTEIFVYNEKESFLIDFITGQITARWPGFSDLELWSRKPSCSFFKGHLVLTRMGVKSETAYVHRTYVGNNKQNHSVELRSPKRENVFINYIKGDPAVVEFTWGTEGVCYYCRLDSKGGVEKRVIPGVLTEEQRHTLFLGHLVRDGETLYGCSKVDTDRLMILKLPPSEKR